MPSKLKLNNKGFFGIIGLLLAVAVISYFAYYIFVHYFGTTTSVDQTNIDQNTPDTTQQAEVDTTPPSAQTGVLDRARSMIQGAQADVAKQGQ